jgi:outer membrane lipoprotein-sorting protein
MFQRSTPKLFLAAALLASLLALAAWKYHPQAAVTGDALAIWRKSLTLGTETTMRAEMTMTRRKHGITYTTQAHIVQGSHGRFRMEYLLPVEARGRIVFSDGHSNWQYEPTQNMLARTELPVPSEIKDRDAEDLIESNYRLVLVSDQATAAGRPTYLLDLLPKHSGKSSQRRWIDKQTYKTLRIETHYTDGILASMVMYDQVALPAAVTEADFQPMQAKSIRHISAPASAQDIPSRDFARMAAGVHLKSKVDLGFQLIGIGVSTLNNAPTTQFLYSDGIETVSIFVQKAEAEIINAPVQWQKLSVSGMSVFQNVDGHLNTLVWTRSGYRYTAVSHLVTRGLQAVIASELR